MSKYTKGPWRFDGHGINGEDGERIAKVQHSGPYCHDTGLPVRNERFDADSLLISAAPNLLSSCIEMAGFVRGILRSLPDCESNPLFGVWDRAMSAINKAEGKE